MLVGFSNMKGHLQKDFCRGRVTNICCERNFMILLRGEINIFHFLQRMIKNIQCLSIRRTMKVESRAMSLP